MATGSWLTHYARLMLFLIMWRDCNGITVDPPVDLMITDLGHLGRLQITWSPPASLVNMKNCSKLYQLEYNDTYKDSWTALRMPMTTYIAQFDLMKNVSVRVYTLLSGPCTNGTMIKSAKYTELVQKPASTGVDTVVHDFVCVYRDMKFVDCKWRRSLKMPAQSQLNLYFWHKGLEKAKECPKYLFTRGSRSGCNFSGNPLPEFTNINFYINCSSCEVPLKPIYSSLKIQNHVKPATIEKLHLNTGPGLQLEVHWKWPVGKVPGHCLEWEVEHDREGADGNMSSLIPAKQMSLTLPSTPDNERHCLRVRSKLNKYCAEKGFWSEWSHPTCHPEKEEVTTQPGWTEVPLYVYITAAFLPILVLCVGTVLVVRIYRQQKKTDCLLSTLFYKLQQKVELRECAI